MPEADNRAHAPSSEALSPRSEHPRSAVASTHVDPPVVAGEPPYPEFAERAFARATGSQPIVGNGVRLLLDAQENYPAWLAAIREARRSILFESYIFADDAVGHEFANALAAKARAGVAVRVVCDWLGTPRVAALRLPAIYEWAEVGDEGGLLAYGPRLAQIYRDIMARQVVKILRGAKPEDIPVEQPTKFELVVNLKTAKALGLTIPESFLLRADGVIE